MVAAGQAFHNSAEAGRIVDRREVAGNLVEGKAADSGDIPDAGEGLEKHLEARSTPEECQEMANGSVWGARAECYKPDTAGRGQAKRDTEIASVGEDAGLDIEVGYMAEAWSRKPVQNRGNSKASSGEGRKEGRRYEMENKEERIYVERR